MIERAAETVTGWDANLYDTKHEFVWKYGADLVSLLAPKAGERILDLGCGTGHLTGQIAESGAQIIGVDRSAEMLEAARKAYPQMEFKFADARDLPFREEFDAVFSNAALHWVLEPELALKNIARSLRPGGRFVAEFGGKGNIRKMEEAFNQALDELGVAKAEISRPWYFPSVGEYSMLAEKCGLEVRYAILFDRPTELSGGEAGLRTWITMFLGTYLAKLDLAKKEKFFNLVEERLRPGLFRDGRWWADYRRLRLVAFR